MSIPPKLQPIIYGVVVFVIFTILSIILKIVTKHQSTDADYFGILTNKDLLMGVVVAVIVTLSHEKKKKLK